MKVQIKPLKGETFDVECEAEMKVEELKSKIAAQKAEFPVEGQKLIYSGRILADPSPLQEYGIKGGEQIVVMVAKAKPKEAPAPPPAADAAAADAPAAPAPAAPAAATPAAAPAPAGGAPPAAGALPASYGNLSDSARTAFDQIRNNPRFIELAETIMTEPNVLSTRMLPALQQNHPQIAAAIRDNLRAFMEMIATALGVQIRPASAGGGAGGTGPEALAALQANPQFAQLAALVAQNPQMLQQVLQALEASDPAVAAAIRANPEAFSRMLQAAAAGGGGAGGGAGGGGAAPGMPGGAQVVQLSEEDNAAVQRLQELGFERAQAAQAYLACDKNEELAANYLFENTMQD